MPQVWIPSPWRDLTAGSEKVFVSGLSIRQVVDNLEASFPGLRSRLCDGDQIKKYIAVVVNGVTSYEGLRQSVAEDSEIHILPVIRGGMFP
jgi:molybdopterin synthase sulfur carrier subunit